MSSCKKKLCSRTTWSSKKETNWIWITVKREAKVRRFYGIQESQMRKYFQMADKMQGITGENLLKILELRLDNVVYRMGFAASRAEARQLVRHGHFLVNGSKVDIPSYLMKVGDVVEIREKSRSSAKFKDIIENHKGNTVRWIEVNADEYKGRIAAEPSREDIDIPIEEHMIVELYSK